MPRKAPAPRPSEPAANAHQRAAPPAPLPIVPRRRDLDALVAAVDETRNGWNEWCELHFHRVGDGPGAGLESAEVLQRRHAALRYLVELRRWGDYLWMLTSFGQLVQIENPSQLATWCKLQLRLLSFTAVWPDMNWRLVKEAVREGVRVIEQLGPDPLQWPLPLPTWPQDAEFQPSQAPRRGTVETGVVSSAWTHLRIVAEPLRQAEPPEPPAPDEAANARAALDTIINWCEDAQASNGVATSSGSSDNGLDQIDKLILQGLLHRHPVLLTRQRIANLIGGLSRNTVAEHLPYLLICGLVSMPKGNTRGIMLTDKGLKLAKSIKPTKPAH